MSSEMPENAGPSAEATLGPPPRRVPLAVQVLRLFRGSRGCFWLWFFLASLGVWVMLEDLVEHTRVAWSVLGLVVYAAVTALGLLLLVRAVRDGLAERHLLVHGHFAVGRVTRDRSVAPKFSRLTLEVTDAAGETRQVSADAYWDDFAEPQPVRRLLYDPSRPDDALLLDNGGASDPPQLDGRGGFRRPKPADLVELLVPLLILLVPVRGIIVLTIRLLVPHAE